MSRAILVLGESGQGKTTSMEALDHTQTAIINTVGKDLPFLGYRKKYKEGIKHGGNMFTPDFSNVHKAREAHKIINALMNYISTERADLKNIVFDDFQYVMALEFFKETGAGNKDWSRFENVGLHAIELFEKARTLRDDITVFFLAHTEDIGTGGNEKTVMKTMGKMVRTQFTPEGVFTVVLTTDPKKSLEGDRILEYRFRTQSNGSDTVKSPKGMFPTYIPNDLDLVVKRLHEYYDEGLTLEESVVLKPILEREAAKTVDIQI